MAKAPFRMAMPLKTYGKSPKTDGKVLKNVSKMKFAIKKFAHIKKFSYLCAKEWPMYGKPVFSDGNAIKNVWQNGKKR